MTPGEGIVSGRFPLGQLVMTRNAAGRLTPEEIADGIVRHVRGDWGDISPEDATENDLSLREGVPAALGLRPGRPPVPDHHRGRSIGHDRLTP